MTADQHLLYTEPSKLIEKHFSIIEKWINKYVIKGFFEKNKIPFLKKEVSKRLLTNLESGDVLAKKSSVTVYGWLVKKVRDVCNEVCNEQDLAILQSDSPNAIIAKYQVLIIEEAGVYQSKGGFVGIELNEVVQEIYEVLLRRIVVKITTFTGPALFRTYFRTIIRNLLHETHNRLKRQTEKHGYTFDIEDFRQAEQGGEEGQNQAVSASLRMMPEDPESWQHQCNAYLLSIRKHPKPQQKEYVFSLKTFYRLILRSPDVFDYWEQCPDDTIVEILSIFGKPYSDMKKGELFTHLAEFISEHDQKLIKANSVQKKFTRFLERTIRHIMITIGYDLAKDFSMENFVYGYYRAA